MEQIISLFQNLRKTKFKLFNIFGERFQTDGISQMSHNEEKDSYRNNSLLGKLNNQINDFLAFEDQSDCETPIYNMTKSLTLLAPYSEEEDGKHYLGSGVFTYKFNEKFTNKTFIIKHLYKKIL